MPVLPIVVTADHNDVLTTKATRVPRVDEGIRRLMDDMVETMFNANGVGLAAGSQRQRQYCHRYRQQKMIAHGRSSAVALQYGRRADVHGASHEFRVTENRASDTMLLCMGLFSIFWSGVGTPSALGAGKASTFRKQGFGRSP